MPIPSPFHPRAAALSESHEWRNWSGYLAAALYDHLHDREYYAMRSAAALIDVSPLYKYELRGPDVLRLANRIFTRDFSRCAVGQVLYTPWCDDDGHIIDDGTVARLAEDVMRVTSAEANLAWFEDCAFGLDVQVRDISTELAAVALQGPRSLAILDVLAPEANLSRLKYYRSAQARIGGLPVEVTRTGYTGDLGYELWISSDLALPLWDLLMEAGSSYGLVPAGMVALDIARIEAGLIMCGVDYISARKALIEEQYSTPAELGLGWAVNLSKPSFVGRRALLAEAGRGAAWKLVGIELLWEDLEAVFGRWNLTPQVAGRASRASIPVYLNDKQIGEVTSHTFSPLQKRYIGLASVRADAPGEGGYVDVEVTVEHTRLKVRARVCNLPFYNPARKRQ